MREGPPLRLPATLTWVGDYPAEGARLAPQRDAFVVPERGVTTSFAALEEQARRACTWLAAAGVGPGTRLAYLGKNSDLFYVVFFAALRVGAIVVPINWRCAAPEVSFFLEDSSAPLLVCDEEFLPLAAQACASLRQRPRIVPTERDAAGEPALRAAIARVAPAVGPGAVADSNAPASWQDAVCLQLYTSGTTGRPKGTLITHRALTVSRYAEVQMPGFPDWEGKTAVCAMPHFHIGGISWTLMGLKRQSTCVVTADPSPGNIVKLLREHSAATTFSVATVIRGIVAALKASGERLPHLETIFYGASPIGQELLRETMQTIGCRFGQFFGMTEVTGSLTFLAPMYHDLAKPGLMASVGRILPGMALDIRDAAGRSLPEDTPGEIWARTPAIMQGYWRRDDATAEAIRDGWYRTGDGGRIDADGFVYLTDRIKDMIITGGENVYPNEVEAALRSFPGLQDVAVVGMPDERWGEIVTAVVECPSPQAIDADALIAHARTRIATYKCPKRVQCVPALPRTASGKIQRAEVRRALLESLRAY